MWTAQLIWYNKWVSISCDNDTKEEAEWQIEKLLNLIAQQRIPFRVVHQDDLATGKVAGAPLKSIDSKASK